MRFFTAVHVVTCEQSKINPLSTRMWYTDMNRRKTNGTVTKALRRTGQVAMPMVSYSYKLFNINRCTNYKALW